MNQNDQINTRRSVFRRFKSAIVAAFAKISHPSRLLRRSRHSHNAPFYPPAANEEEARRMLMEWLAQIAIERGEYPVDDRRHPVYPCMAVNPDNASITESEYSLELDENKDLSQQMNMAGSSHDEKFHQPFNSTFIHPRHNALMLEVMPDCEGSTDGAYHRGDAGAQVMYDSYEVDNHPLEVAMDRNELAHAPPTRRRRWST